MKLREVSQREVEKLAREEGVTYRTGPFCVRLRTDIPGFLETLVGCYGHVDLLPSDTICHFHVSMLRVHGARRWIRPQVQFAVDGIQPFEPYPLDHAFPMYEWGLNWCIGSSANYYLMLHSAVVEKGGHALILPATPGSGKSTLCGGLVSRGWRLLSDEFGAIRHEGGMVLPVPRAAPLKNQSIDIIRKFAPELTLGPIFERTRKGDVAHLWPPEDSIQRQTEPATPRWVVFPRYSPGGSTHLQVQHRAVALTKLVNNSFNYRITLDAGFRTLTRLVQQVDCYDLPNGDLGEALDAIETLRQESGS